MAGSGSHPKQLDKYLIESENIVFIIHRHWAVVFEPFASVVAGLIVIGFLDQNLSGDALLLRDIAIALWFGVVLRCGWKWLDWRRELFLATNRRLMLVHGIITRQVDIMPMAKVTDMRYDRTIPGQIIGYGTYILESAGQDQALSTIKFVPEPDYHYKQISQVIFAPTQGEQASKLAPAATGSKIPISEPEHAWWRRS